MPDTPTELTDQQRNEYVLEVTRAIRDAIAKDNWIVPKVASDVNQSVKPMVHGRWISWDRCQSDPEHARLFAAQLLAAADEQEEATR